MADSFAQAQQDRLADLRTLTEAKRPHARFLAELEDAAPGEILDDIELPHGVSRRVADALIADFEWIIAPAPAPDTSTSPYPAAYRALLVKTARSSAQASRTRADNFVWSGFSFGGK